MLAKVVELGIDFEVWHQCGEFDPEEIRADYERAGVTASVKPFIDSMGPAYQWADFAISTAGTLTVAELRAAGVPALLVPNTTSGTELELRNAQHSGSWWSSVEAWSENAVAMQLAATLRDRLKLDRIGRRMRERAPRYVAGRIVDECESLLAELRGIDRERVDLRASHA
jgi:UDP-N-acetylglucosamine--N-acetylmuramyl-(pentapeptide) pyrophosphoryl-undecaprenol N-acetylglucosamine transferase